MSLPAFLRFDPVPVRARHDGWTPELQRRFILHLARGSNPGEAARRLGRSRQTAYNLRRKRGAEGFAAAWDAALQFANQAEVVGRSSPPLAYGLETILVPRFYRGRLVGFVQREDARGLLQTLTRLDRLVAAFEDDEETVAAGERLFDELYPSDADPSEDDKDDEIRRPVPHPV